MFGVGDTVGCLVNFRLNQALFTKNGRDLGTLSCLLPAQLSGSPRQYWHSNNFLYGTRDRLVWIHR